MKNLQLSHGPLMAVGDLQVMIDYLLLARQRVRGMMDKGMTVEAVRKQFHMNEYKGWDREAHFPVIAAAILSRAERRRAGNFSRDREDR